MNINATMPTEEICGHTAYFFDYNATTDMRFHCSMLCEVGQPFIPIFERMIKKRKLNLSTIEVDQKPWIITIHTPDAKSLRRKDTKKNAA